jgi:hypothetical protein
MEQSMRTYAIGDYIENVYGGKGKIVPGTPVSFRKDDATIWYEDSSGAHWHCGEREIIKHVPKVPVRILCTDGPILPGTTEQCIVGIIPGYSKILRWSQAGKCYGWGHVYNLVNVPPPKVVKTYDLVMHRSATGCVQVGKHEVGWTPRSNTVIARKTVTLTEGEGL